MGAELGVGGRESCHVPQFLGDRKAKQRCLCVREVEGFPLEDCFDMDSGERRLLGEEGGRCQCHRAWMLTSGSFGLVMKPGMKCEGGQN